MTHAARYDRVNYPTYSYRMTRPDRLELVGRLLGLDPPPAATARVLEVGCGTGGNIIPMAERFPSASFVGFDIAPTQITVARELAEVAGVGNVSLEVRDILEIDIAGAPLGEFDYIVAQGMWSWIPERVRERLVKLFARHLAPRGLVFFSHNVKPGGQVRRLAHELMRRHVDPRKSPEDQIAQARGLLAFVAAHATEPAYRDALAAQASIVNRMLPDVLMHDYLNEDFHVSWFHEVADDLAAHGLAYLSDAAIWRTPAGAGDDVVERESLEDCRRNRPFRNTLACHAGARPVRPLVAEKLAGLRVSSSAGIEGAAIRLGSATLVTQDVEDLKFVKRLTDAWPASFPIEDPARVLSLFEAGVVELERDAEPLALAPTKRPRAMAYARLAAKRGLPVPSIRHDITFLDEEEQRLLPALDGTLTAQQLAASVKRHPTVIQKVLGRLVAKGMIFAD
jgi:SAM-dependent methyltransferase